jgi:ABC-type glycerol-3-phosphate transport system substrate-binding protein
VDGRSIIRRPLLGAGGAGAGGVLAACGPGGAGGGQTDVAPAARLQPGTAVRYHTYVADPQVKAEVDRLWAARHPEVRLEYSVSGAGEILTKLTAELAGYRRQITFEWGLGPVPLGPGATGRSSIMTGSAWMQLEAAGNREAGWSLLQTVTSAEYQRAAGSVVGYMPPRKEVLAEYAGQEPPRSVRILLDAAEQVYLFPKTPWSSAAEAALGPLLNDLWAGKRSASEVAQEAKRLIDPIVQQPFAFKTG